ncbi:MAG: ferritin [archaeon]
MKLNEKMEKALNEQINKELFSEYLYLSMAAHFEGQALKGFSHWMKKQANEEHTHAMKLFDYMLERGGNIKLTAIDSPKAEWKTPLNAFEEAYAHEKFITESINKVVDAANENKDKATAVFLNWFVSEQVEEEANADEIVQKLKMVGPSTGGLFALDHQLGKRE